MEGMFQKFLKHQITKDSRVHDYRINLTWRWIRKHDQASCTKKASISGITRKKLRTTSDLAAERRAMKRLDKTLRNWDEFCDEEPMDSEEFNTLP